MNIKNEETQRLSHQLAARTGESVTTAVTVAVRERLERLTVPAQARSRAEEILRLGRLIAPALQRTADVPDVEDLYDPLTGLPR